MAFVTSIFKTEDTSNPNNYRPISTLCCSQCTGRAYLWSTETVFIITWRSLCSLGSERKSAITVTTKPFNDINNAIDSKEYCVLD